MSDVHNIQYKKDRMIEALEKTNGIVTEACKLCNIARQSHYDWMKEDAEYKKAVDLVNEISLDFVEDSLYKQIKELNTTATIFYLKTKGKKRGYVESVEPSSSYPKEIEINVVHRNLDT